MQTFALVIGAAFFANLLTAAWIWGLYGMTQAEKAGIQPKGLHYVAAALPPLLVAAAVIAFLV